MSTIAFDQFALTRIADFARTLSRLHQASRHRMIDDDEIDREFNAVCMSVWGYTTDDISDELFSAEDHAFLDALDEARARIFAGGQGYDLVDDEGMLIDWWGYCWMILAEKRGLLTPENRAASRRHPRCRADRRDARRHIRKRRVVCDHVCPNGDDLHFIQPRADVGGQSGVGRDRREFHGPAAARADAGIGERPVGGGNHIARTERGVERNIDRRKSRRIAAVAGAVGAQLLAVDEGVLAVGVALAV